MEKRKIDEIFDDLLRGSKATKEEISKRRNSVFASATPDLLTNEQMSIILYKPASLGPSESFSPIVSLQIKSLLDDKNPEDVKELHRLMRSVMYHCYKLELHFEGKLYKL